MKKILIPFLTKGFSALLTFDYSKQFSYCRHSDLVFFLFFKQYTFLKFLFFRFSAEITENLILKYQKNPFKIDQQCSPYPYCIINFKKNSGVSFAFFSFPVITQKMLCQNNHKLVSCVKI